MTIRHEQAARVRGVGAVLLALCAIPTSAPARAIHIHNPGVEQPTLAAKPAATARLPIRFEANRGQAEPGARFVAHCRGFDAVFSPDAAVLAPSGHREAAVRLGFGATTAYLAGEQRLSGLTNYLCGRDPRAWRTNVEAYARVRYAQVAPGVDAVFYGDAGQLEYDLVLEPGADPEAIAIQIDGASGVEVDATGALLAHTAAGDVRQEAPRIYQQTSEGRRPVSGHYVLTSANRASVCVGAFDHALPLVVDPPVGFSALFGGNSYDDPTGFVVDPQGATYLVGNTESPDFPGARMIGGSPGASLDVFVAKLGADGSSLDFVTVIGGTGVEVAPALALDAKGNIFISGTTDSDDFPVTAGAFQPTHAGLYDAFALKLGPTGDALLYSTYLGGALNDYGFGIAVDGGGEAVVTGRVESIDFPTVNAFQPTSHSDAPSGFISKLDAAGSGLVYSTYLGGTSAGGSGDAAYRVAMDAGGNTVVAGIARSINFPVLNAIQPHAAGAFDAFVTKVTASGELVFSTYLGGSGSDFIDALAVDVAGDIYLAGGTTSPDFATVNAFQTANAGNNDAFVVKLKSDGSKLIYSSYLGGASNDSAYGIAVDAKGSLVVGGSTASSDFPVVDASQTSLDGTFDGFMAKVDPTGSALVYSTFVGGSDTDQVGGVGVDGAGNAYAVGYTLSADFPTTAGAVREPGGFYDVFVTKFLTPLPPDFSLATDPAILTVARRQKGTVDVEITRTGGFAGEVEVTAPDTSVLKIKLKPPSGSTTGDRVSFAFKVKKTAPIGMAELVFTGRDADGTTHTASLTLVVQ